MLPLANKFGLESHGFRLCGLLGDTVRETPNGRASIAFGGIGTNGITGLEREVGLDVVYRRVVVVLDLA